MHIKLFEKSYTNNKTKKTKNEYKYNIYLTEFFLFKINYLTLFKLYMF